MIQRTSGHSCPRQLSSTAKPQTPSQLPPAAFSLALSWSLQLLCSPFHAGQNPLLGRAPSLANIHKHQDSAAVSRQGHAHPPVHRLPPLFPCSDTKKPHRTLFLPPPPQPSHLFPAPKQLLDKCPPPAKYKPKLKLFVQITVITHKKGPGALCERLGPSAAETSVFF